MRVNPIHAVTRRLRRVVFAAIAAASLAVVAWSRVQAGPTEDELMSQLREAVEALEDVRIESLLCLDQFKLETLVRQVGKAEACEGLVDDGDSSFGTLWHIGQVHKPPVLTTELEDESVIQYQLAILRLLLARDAHTVFVEGSPVGEPVSLADTVETLVHDHFVHWQPRDSLDGAQRWVLRHSLTALAYKALRPSAVILGADDMATLNRLLSDHEDLGIVEEDSLIFERRERVAMEAVCRHMAKHRGEDVYLVFGANHTFELSDVPAGSPAPLMMMATFPGLAAMAPRLQPWICNRLSGQHDLATRYLEKLDYINPKCFEKLDETEQLFSLHQPFMLNAQVPDGDSLMTYLRSHARSARVRREVPSVRYVALKDQGLTER